MAMQGRINDPLFHFETHFPERLSRLHLNPEFAGTGNPVQRKKRSRARNSARYKTQPVTFDEIQEVDEENIKEEDKSTEGLKHQFAAFSKSMDGLVPKHRTKLMTDTILEVVDDVPNDTKPVKTRLSDIGRVHSDSPELRLQSVNAEPPAISKENKENEPENNSKPEVPLGLPPSGPNTRRQRMTAKAKKRQMQAEVPGGGENGT